MLKVKYTCPFTGKQFNATEDKHGNVYFTHPLTHETCQMQYDVNTGKLSIDKTCFDEIEICTQRQACEILGLTRQRVNKIAHDNVIPSFEINGALVFIMRDVISYKKSRRVGKPAKE